MKHGYLQRIGWLGITALLAGCTHPKESPSLQGRSAFAAMQQAVTEVANQSKGGLVRVKMEGVKASGNSYTIGAGGSLRSSSSRSDKTYCGLILDADGHILLPRHAEPADAKRILVWVGDTEYSAKILKSDERLDLAILEIKPEAPLAFLPRPTEETFSAGAWGVLLEPSGEDKDFEIFTSLGFCRGEVAGRYGEFRMDGTPSMTGSLLIDLDGQLVGILRSRGSVRSMIDLEEDLAVLLADAMNPGEDEEEAKKKGWLGILTQPVNKAYGRELDLPRSALWAVHVFEGSPAAEAGLQAGDVLVGLYNKPLRFNGSRANTFFIQSLRPKPGKAFTLDVIRDGEPMVLSGTFAEAPEPDTLLAEDLGVAVQSISNPEVIKKNLFTEAGVLVTEVVKGSPAAFSGSMGSKLLNTGDVIVALGGEPTPTLEEFNRVLDQVRQDKPEVLLVGYVRGRSTGYASLNLSLGKNGKGENQ